MEHPELPFYERPDLTPYLTHLTKGSGRNREDSDAAAFERLLCILRDGVIKGTGSYINAPHKAACFMDIPFNSLKYVLKADNTACMNPRYGAFGIILKKKVAYSRDCRPVLYLSKSEQMQLKIPKVELWRTVRFEPQGDQVINWLHEREWRCNGDFTLPKKVTGVLVKNLAYAERFAKELRKHSEDFRSRPLCILPLEVICQGLIYL